MEIKEVLDIIKAFFDAILDVLEAMGIIKPKADDTTGTTGTTEA